MIHEDHNAQEGTPDKKLASRAAPDVLPAPPLFAPQPLVRFRSKRGTPIPAGVVPASPPATDSAIIPTFRTPESQDARNPPDETQPLASFMTELPGQAHMPPVDGPSPGPPSADPVIDPCRLQQPRAPRFSWRRLSTTTRRGTAVASFLFCGLLVGLNGSWWADRAAQPHGLTAGSSGSAGASASGPSFLQARPAALFAATDYNSRAQARYPASADAGESPATPEKNAPDKMESRTGNSSGKKEAPRRSGQNGEKEAASQESLPSKAPQAIQAPPAPAVRKRSPSPSPGKTQSKLPALKRCTQGASFFEREKCKWKICNGSWGRNGCPSYD